MRKSISLLVTVAVLVLGFSAAGEAHVRGSVWIGPVWGPGWGPGWGGPYYSYPYPYYPPSPPVVIQQQPQEYIYQQAPAPQSEQKYWYYCSESKTYYPYVKSCPGGWKKVLPQASPPKPEAAPEDDSDMEE